MKVAIIDDDESVCRSISRLLLAAGMLPSAFTSAEEFLSARPSGLDCVLLDIRLGAGMSGPELHRRLLDQGDRTPVIYHSATDDPRVQTAARRLGCAAFMRKGVAFKLMLSELARIREVRALESTKRTMEPLAGPRWSQTRHHR